MNAMLALLTLGGAMIGLVISRLFAYLERVTLALVLGVFGLLGVVLAMVWNAAAHLGRWIGLTAARKRLISRPLLRLFQKVLPPISQTEQEALDAGNVWWDGELFSGKPRWDRLLSFAAPKLSEDERAFLDGPVERLCELLDDWEITHIQGDLPPPVWDFLKSQGFFAMIIPKRYGGLEFSSFAHSEVLLKIATRSSTAAAIVGVPNSLGPAELLLHYGTDEQRDYYLPRLADGREIPCFALTSPAAGSDATSIEDTGIICRRWFDGKEVLGIRLNWDKRYITLAPIATLLGLAFKLYDPDHLISEKEEYGISCALVPTHLPGISIGRRHFPINIPFQNGPTQGKDVFVPLDYLIGGLDMAGQGWRMLVENLSVGRSITLPTNATGGSKLAVYATGAYCQVRKQFHLPIGQFEGVEEALASMGGRLYAMDAVRQFTLSALDAGERPAVPAAIVKYHVTEMARQVANDAMDIHGGKGIMLGPSNYLARGYESAPIAITVEGANILTRSLMIFGQGAIRAHPYVLKEMQAAQNPDFHEGVKQFDHVFFAHIGYTLGNAARAFVHGLTDGRYARVPEQAGPMRRWYAVLSRYSAAFALLSDTAMLTLGGKLKRKERLSARLGDLLSDLYIASAVLKRYHDQGAHDADRPLAEWVLTYITYHLEERIHEILLNLPNRKLAALLRFLVLPRGRRAEQPGDKAGHEVARLLQTPNAARDRLIAGVYRGSESEHDVIALLGQALPMAEWATGVERKLVKEKEAGAFSIAPGSGAAELVKAAVDANVISEDEGEKMQHYLNLVSRIVAVDDFESDMLGVHPPSDNETRRSEGIRAQRAAQVSKEAGAESQAS